MGSHGLSSEQMHSNKQGEIASLAGKLKFVKISSGKIDLGRFPDYMIIGPQRTGTTWLARNLRIHPQVFCSYPKEIYFFNKLVSPEHPRHRSNELSWYLRFFRDPPSIYMIKMLHSLFRFGEPYRPLVRGEATASYAAMRPELIEEIVALNPDLKAIMMIRDPVARAWSHAKKDLARQFKRPASDVPDEQFRDFFVDPYQLRCGSYTDMIATWSSRLREGNLYVGVYDDIATRPGDFLREVFDFLGVESSVKYVTRLAHARINPTRDDSLPQRHREHLRQLFHEELTRLARDRGLSWD